MTELNLFNAEQAKLEIAKDKAHQKAEARWKAMEAQWRKEDADFKRQEISFFMRYRDKAQPECYPTIDAIVSKCMQQLRGLMR